MKSYLIFFLSSAFALTCASGQIRQLVEPAPQAKSLRIYSQWTLFLHPRFGFEVPIPPGVGTSGKPEEANEPQFQSADGNFIMSAWGGMARELASKVLDDQWNAAQRKANREITYQKRGKTWFVVSGTILGGVEFYEKFIMQGQHAAFLSITFPKARIRQYEPWVEQIEDGFRPVPLPDGPAETSPQLFRGLTEVVVEGRSAERKHSLESAEPSPAPKQEIQATERTLTRPTVAGSAPAGEKLPIALKVVGKPGYVYSPFSEKYRLVDVKGMASGAKVKCPYTMKNFRLP